MADASPIYPPADQPFQFIDEEDDLLRAVDEISGYKEVAIDLEHHSHRSFLGITCLMQISTRDKDYVIDTLALRSKMSILLTITADPSIVKVFHGCDRDIMWLQRDLGLYVVNCFDTYFAAKVLSYPALSLAHLVKVVCGVTLDKKYQLADWRQRPLPEEMLFYAKNDTHYLLYIYDCLRKEICRYKGTQFVAAVFDLSKNMCLQRFDKDPFNPRGYMKLIPSSKRTKELSFTEMQENMLAVLWDYRDSIARSIDESVTYVMSNAEMIRIARACPKDVSALLSSGPLSEFTRSHAEEVLAKIWKRDNVAPVSLKPMSTPIGKVPGLSIDRKSRVQESDVRLEVDSPFFSELAIEREIAEAPNWGQMGRVDGYSTVSSFNPSRHLSPSSSSSRANKMQSPIPNVEEVCFFLINCMHYSVVYHSFVLSF
jgi:ribonuclease D